MDYEIYKATEGRKTYLVFTLKEIFKNHACVGDGVIEACKEANKYFKVAVDKLDYMTGYAEGDNLWFGYKPRKSKMVIAFFVKRGEAT